MIIVVMVVVAWWILKFFRRKKRRVEQRGIVCSASFFSCSLFVCVLYNVMVVEREREK